MDRSENNVQIISSNILIKRVLHTSIYINIILLLAYPFYQIIISIKLNILKSNGIHLFDNRLIIRRNNLCPIIPINLVTIVFRRIVRCCKYNSCITFFISHRERKLWRRAVFLEKQNIDSISRKYICYYFPKFFGIISHIIGDSNFDSFAFKLLVQVVCQPLSSLSKRIFIKPISSHAHHSAHSSCSKF